MYKWMDLFSFQAAVEPVHVHVHIYTNVHCHLTQAIDYVLRGSWVDNKECNTTCMYRLIVCD